MRDVEVLGEIRLGQFLKLADVVDVGSDAKVLLAEGAVRVNGAVETRRGRQLAAGDVVEAFGRRWRVAPGDGPAGAGTRG